ncbi:energy-coupling factor transporter ATPase [Gemelliphila palaticanis]|uniref:Energy-coupling factor transporter ATPase n=1 Tax=Gemelliphila palaticanis TaxID=81950 RepID=A0ABX2SZ69_9BACL|nr:energy-coupling factor transporter ATPase [Gemella palaticanis]MBF0715635.1 energy-coupling factor transporter ATPase [Gemella palaticanis]NYS47565.1 energy-coupling factor transporter ATPase [Gemella palaticanis]
MLKFNNVTFKYPNSKDVVLDNISFEVEKSEWLTILGNNGSGKSTITKLICGQYNEFEGEIIFKDLHCNRDNYEKILENVSIVFQNPDNQFVGVTVEEDIAFGLENRNIPAEDMDTIIEEMLDIVDMKKYRKSEPKELSGGQKQRVAIASALAVSPKLLILDEATSMLDPLAREQILNYIKYINKEHNITVISITHDVEELKYSDNILLIDSGKIVKKSTSRELYENNNILEEFDLEIPFIDKLKYDFNKSLGKELFNYNEDMEGVVEKVCKLILKK